MATGEAPTAAATEVATTEQPDFVKTIQATVRILSSFSLLDWISTTLFTINLNQTNLASDYVGPNLIYIV